MRLTEPLPFPEALTAAAVLANPESFDRFRRSIDPAWIEEALRATGTATLRKRRLPAEQVLWLVIGMALFRDSPIDDVVDRLDLALPAPGGRETPLSKAAIPAARARLGPEPLQWLFEHTGYAWAHASARAHAWRGLALFGADGTTLRVPDSDANRAHFGGQYSGEEIGEGAYPLVRVVVLMALRSHLLAAAAFGPHKLGEHALAADLWANVPDDSLTIVDRLFLGAALLLALSGGGSNRQWLLRAKANTRWRVVERLGPGDAIVEMDVSSEARIKDPTLPRVWRARAIEYQHRGFKPQTLLTSMLDAERYPAREVVALYHERWELENGYDEIKTEMLEREEALRSKSPALIEQELWGILLTYNLVRLEMERVAEELGVEPTRISFVMALRLVRDEWLWCAVASPGAIPKRLLRLRATLARFVLPPRRAERSYPRAVKKPVSKYPSTRSAAKAKAKAAAAAKESAK